MLLVGHRSPFVSGSLPHFPKSVRDFFVQPASWPANRAHQLLVVHQQQELSRFMQHLCANISKEVGGWLRNWRGCFWERSYDGIVVSDEPEAQWARLNYCLSHGVKEGLVESSLDWPNDPGTTSPLRRAKCPTGRSAGPVPGFRHAFEGGPETKSPDR